MAPNKGVHANTFSVVARCARTGQLGVAVSSAVPAVGSICPFVKSGVGAVSTQSWVNPYLALEALRLIEAGNPVQQSLAAVLDTDDAKDLRQIGVVGHRGESAAWSGKQCTPWFGHVVADNFAIQGNMLTGASVIEAMAAAMRASESLDLAERLVLALEAGAAGSPQHCACTSARTIRFSSCVPTSTHARYRNSGACMKSRRRNSCHSSAACRERDSLPLHRPTQ